MTGQERDVETLARVLAKADGKVYWTDALPGKYRDQARALTPVVAAIRNEAKAEAWAEGYLAGTAAMPHEGNPYRALLDGGDQ